MFSNGIWGHGFSFDFFDKGSDNSAHSHGGETKGCEGRQAGSPNDPLLKKLKKDLTRCSNLIYYKLIE